MCVWCASGTFRIDPQHGRSRVYAQWVDDEDKIEVRFVSLFLLLDSESPRRITCPSRHVIAQSTYTTCVAVLRFETIRSKGELAQANLRPALLLWLGLHTQQCWLTQWLVHGLQDAIASCPVDCIHWVEKEQLPSLEYVMRNKVKVTDVGTMMGGAGHVADVFAAATQFLKKRDKE